MPGPEVVVEEAPVLVGLDMAINAIIVVLFLWALKTVWQVTFEPILLGIADATKIDEWRIHIDPLKKLRAVDAYVLRQIDKGIATSQNAMGFWFHQTARVQGWIVDETWKIARDTLHFGEWVVQTYGPLLVKTATTVVFPWPKIYKLIRSEVAKALPKVGKVTHNLSFKSALQAAELATLWAAFGAIAGALPVPGRIGSLPHGVGIPKSWTKWRTKVDRRLTKVEAFAAAGVFAGLMANVLGVSGKCLRSGNVGKATRRLCGLDTSILDSLLLGTALLTGPLSVVTLANAMLDVEDEMLTLVKAGFAELKDL